MTYTEKVFLKYQLCHHRECDRIQIHVRASQTSDPSLKCGVEDRLL